VYIRVAHGWHTTGLAVRAEPVDSLVKVERVAGKVVLELRDIRPIMVNIATDSEVTIDKVGLKS